MTHFQEEAVASLAREKLGVWRHLLRRELRSLQDLLDRDEHLEAMALARFGPASVGLMVATERRALLLHKRLFRRVRCDEIRYEAQTSVIPSSNPSGFVRLTLASQATERAFHAYPAESVGELIRLLRKHGVRTQYDWPTADPKPPRWYEPIQKLAGGAAVVLLTYAVIGTCASEGIYKGAPEPYEVGDCLDPSQQPVPCDFPEAEQKLLREADSDLDCPGASVVFYRPNLVPWAHDDTFCTTPVQR